jgi:hypothetical protein
MDPRYFLVPMAALVMAVATSIYQDPSKKASEWSAAGLHQLTVAVFPSVGFPVVSRLSVVK